MHQQGDQPKRVRGVDRLSSLIVAAALVGCSGPTNETPPPPPSRTASVAATPPPEVSLNEFCDVRPSEEVRPFAWPELESPGDTATHGWGWVNVWATWCAPCIEEMPRIAAWEERLRKDIGPGDVVFLSLIHI